MKAVAFFLVFVISISLLSTVDAQWLQLQIRETGYMTGEWNTWLVNPGPSETSFDGYTISDGAERLNVAGWRSISSVVESGDVSEVIAVFGANALGFGEANPNPGNLTELIIGDGAIMQQGSEWNFGPIIDPGSAPDYSRVDGDLSFLFSSLGVIQTPPPGFQTGIIIPGVPESSTLVLGVFGVIFGLLFLKRCPTSCEAKP